MDEDAISRWCQTVLNFDEQQVANVIGPAIQAVRMLTADPAELTRLLRVGADRARGVAAATLDRVHRAIGMLPA